MPVPSLYLDECVDRGLVPILRQRGFRVATARAENLTGADDRTQIEYATNHDLAIFSHDAHHFISWHYRLLNEGRAHACILLASPTDVTTLALRVAMMLHWLATLPDYRSRVFRWGDLQLKLTQGFRLPGYSEREVATALGRA